MRKQKRPFDFRKFFTLLGLMGGMLVFTALMLGLLISLYDWFGWWGVAGLALGLLGISRVLVRRFGTRVWSQEPSGETFESSTEAQQDKEVQ